MKVQSKSRLITLLDDAIKLGEQLHVVIDDCETFMKDTKCNNIQASPGAQNLQ